MRTATVHLFRRFDGDWFDTVEVDLESTRGEWDYLSGGLPADDVELAVFATGYADCDASIDAEVAPEGDHLTVWVRLR